MRTSLNRVLLGACGVVLTVAGGSVLATGLGAPTPSWWPYGGRGDVLLSDADRTRWRDEQWWWWPVVVAALAVAFLLALWWLLAQLSRRRLGEVLVDTGDGEGALLRARAMEGVLESDAEGQEGIRRAHARLTGRRTAPAARVRLVLEPYARPVTALERLTSRSLAHARDSAGLERLPAEVRIRAAKHRTERVN